MADSTYGFRTALGGFHKGDVNGYIEKMAAQHRSELLKYEQTILTLQNENRALNQQLNLLMMATPLAAEPAPQEPVAPQEQPAPAPVAEPVAAPAPVPAAEQEALVSQELRAYRRAEAVERNANQRAKKLYQQMSALCDGAMDEFQAADTTAKQTIELILAQAKMLEQSYAALSEALCASREKLAFMNDELFVAPEEE